MICGKIIYSDYNSAIDAIKGIKIDSSSNKTATRVYFCSDCNGYHLATENKLKFISQKKRQKNKIQINTENKKLKQNNYNQSNLIIHNRLKFKIT